METLRSFHLLYRESYTNPDPEMKNIYSKVSAFAMTALKLIFNIRLQSFDHIFNRQAREGIFIIIQTLMLGSWITSLAFLAMRLTGRNQDLVKDVDDAVPSNQIRHRDGGKAIDLKCNEAINARDIYAKVAM